jgi:sugar phosphate isomerase/epimerase
MPKTPDLIASCWTSAGNVAPLFDSELSPHTAIERVTAAAGAGFKGYGLAADDLRAVDDTLGFGALKDLSRELGMKHVEVEYATGWWHDESKWRDTWDLLIRAATGLDAKVIKIGTEFGEPLSDFSHLVDPFRRLAQEATDIGARVALEPLPFSLIGSMPQGADLVAEINHPAAGLVVDYWHIFRAKTSLEDLEKRVPIEFIFGIELNDALDEIVGTLFEDTRDNRKLIGEGNQDVVGFIKTIQKMGYQGAWGVEILSKEHRAKPIEVGLQDAIDSARRAFALAANHSAN